MLTPRRRRLGGLDRVDEHHPLSGAIALGRNVLDARPEGELHGGACRRVAKRCLRPVHHRHADLVRHPNDDVLVADVAARRGARERVAVDLQARLKWTGAQKTKK